MKAYRCKMCKKVGHVAMIAIASPILAVETPPVDLATLVSRTIRLTHFGQERTVNV